MRAGLVRALAANAGCDLLVVEGVMGLFDGAAGGAGSTADLAAMLGLPVVLVVDVSRQAQSAAAIVEGFARHRAGVTVKGVILNRVSGDRHRRLVTEAMDAAGIAVIGAVPRDAALALPSRHLGLVQADEHANLDTFIANAAATIAAHVDLDALMDLAAPVSPAPPVGALPPPGKRVAVAADAAFAFVYPHLLQGWRAQGADILPFSPLANETPDPSADTVYLPGGYPELHAGQLSASSRFLDGLRAAARRGALVYGECGGFMVLGDALVDAEGRTHAMAGLLPVETTFAERRLQLGYRTLVHDSALPWPASLRGHEFHHSTLLAQGDAAPLFAAHDAAGDPLPPMGLRRGRVMGSYAHVIDAEG
jgi:cobyrinic acid a,c-diamide synthase